MKMEAILAKTVSGRIASVLILYQVDFWFLRPRIAQKAEVYLVLLHLEALSLQNLLGQKHEGPVPPAAPLRGLLSG